MRGSEHLDQGGSFSIGSKLELKSLVLRCQKWKKVRVLAFSGSVECSAIANITNVDLSPVRNQNTDNFFVTPLAREHQCRASLCII
jgi:alpha-L-arabinofuranosidase